MGAKRHGQRSGELYLGKRPRGYAAWVNMRQRCTNPQRPDYHDYGLRGITFDRQWETFEGFIADMGEPAAGMTLERVDTNKDYGPDNCRWATRAEQALNKRNNVRYEYNGKNQTLSEWSRETGIGRITILKRLQRGWPIARALTEAPAY
jgi:hypothetical protein